MMLLDSLHAELRTLPEPLRNRLETLFRQWDANVGERSYPDRLVDSIAEVWLASEFVAESCCRDPQLLFDLVESGDLFEPYRNTGYADRQPAAPETEAELMTALRRYRRREMIRIAWRDLAGWAPLQETLAELSALAECCIGFALDFLYARACEKMGTPVLADGRPQQLVVLGMGKLGACELNFSSDIDLIFAFAEDGVLEDRKQTSYGEFFGKIGCGLIKVLDQVTADGFVFRTDLRLRPFGDSGPMVMTFDGMEHYYLTQAREWERYAMIKARQVAGDPNTGPQLLALLHAFVYRRYLDYGTFEELRSLKYKITQELQRKDRLENIKLGPGGIREIEFIGQAFQLVRGGQEKTLQLRAILAVLQRLSELSLLTRDDAEQLQVGYRFLRRVENHIQQYQDRQTHELPADPDVRLILARSMGYDDWEAFKTELDRIRDRVHAIFDLVFALSRQEKKNLEIEAIWIGQADDDELIARLQRLGFSRGAEVLARLREFKHSAAVRRLTAKGAGVLDRLMPSLIEAMPQVEQCDETLKRILQLLEAVAGRNVYLSLLAENPEALGQLVKLSAASPWICAYLAMYPVLFDELLDTRTLFEPLNKQRLKDELAAMLEGVAVRDLEQQMMLLRKFKHVNVLRVAAADIMQVVPLMVVSDYLTYIAEAVLEQVVELSWRFMLEKHGPPPGAGAEVTGFGVLGFGKLGGFELGYGSDLDLVFLYDCPDTYALTAGPKTISCSHFYGLLGQKVMHMLNTRLLSGILYEADMRLRPSGNAGLLVAHAQVYEDYLRDNAWTWEHQALVRGRFIAGDPLIRDEFEGIRKRVLCLPRQQATLKREVREMREKMRDNLAPKDAAVFDLKQSKGGIADIEFIVQFAILNHAAENASLATYTDNIRLLTALAKHGYLSETVAEQLQQAYCAYRDYGHKQALQDQPAIAPADEFAETRARVERIWRDYME